MILPHTNKKCYSHFRFFPFSMKKGAQSGVKICGECTLRVVRDGKTIKKKVMKNLVVDAGLTAIANRLGDATPDSTLLISYIAVGDDNTAAAAGDTVLGNEIDREAVTSRANSGAVVSVATVFAAGVLPADTYEEFGVFIEGSDTADTGTLLSRVIGSIAITALDALFIDWRFTLANG